MKLSEKILMLRKQVGLSQEELAEKLSVSRQAVSRWEVGSALPDAGNLLQLSKLFGVTADYLLNDDCQSVPNLPTARTAKSTRKQPQEKKPRTFLGIGLALLGLIGLVALYAVAGRSPIYYPDDGAGTMVSSASGFAVFVSTHRLEWLVALCVLAIMAGTFAQAIPKLRVLPKAHKNTNEAEI